MVIDRLGKLTMTFTPEDGFPTTHEVFSFPIAALPWGCITLMSQSAVLPVPA